MRLAADTIAAVAAGHLPADLNGLNAQMQALGWSPAGSIGPPYCRQWRAGALRVDLASEGEYWYLDIAFRELDPSGIEERGSEALEEEAERQIPVYEGLLRELIDHLSGRVRMEDVKTPLFEDVDFLVSSEWNISGHPFVMGVLATDIDIPILVMARVGVQAVVDGQ